MCGHGTIGTVTMAIEHGLIQPKTPGVLRLDTPAGLVVAEYRQEGAICRGGADHQRAVLPPRRRADASNARCSARSAVDVAYGGNFYAIVEPQKNFRDMADYSAGELVAWSPVVRQRLNEKYSFVHPENPDINRLSHMLWTGAPTRSGSRMRATPCSTATRRSTARPAAPAPRRAWRSCTPRAG